MNRIIECVPNFSEGRDTDKIERIVSPFRGKAGVKVLDYQSDQDHNRLVVTIVGEPEALRPSLIEAMGAAIELIDMREHQGQHPRMGAIDVVPFIPIKKVTMDEAIDISKQVGREVAEKYQLPVFLYEQSATRANRKNLATIRKGQFEGMAEKIKAPDWTPDFGPPKVHPTAGVTAIGARMPLVAFNINLDTDNIEIANEVAKRVRHSSGGLPYCKAMGVALRQRGIVQVSMNLTDYQKTALYQVFEVVKTEAARHGVSIVGSEIIGLVPMAALIDTAVHYMHLDDFSVEQVLEYRIME